MTFRTNRSCVLIALLVAAFLLDLSSGLHAADDSLWMTNMEKAMKKAQKEKKDLLVDFTGSDWCGWCIRLDNEVFKKELFKTKAPADFVLVALDFPRQKKLPAELKKQNDLWQKKLGVRGFPTIYLLDGKGRPYAKTGYQQGGAEKYLTHLAELRKVRVDRDAALAKAEKLKGLEKAKLLDEAIAKMDPAVIFSSYKDIVDTIIKADKKNKAGLKNKYLGILINAEVGALMQARDVEGALKKIAEAEKTLKPEGQVAQDILFLKSQAYYGKGDMKGAEAAMRSALAAAPEGKKAADIKRILDNYFSPVMIRFNKINETIQKGQLDEALKLAEAAIKELKPTGGDAHILFFARGLVHMRKDDNKKAREDFEAALKAAPQGKYARYIKSTLENKLK